MQAVSIKHWGNPIRTGDMFKVKPAKRHDDSFHQQASESVCEKYQCENRGRCKSERLCCWHYVYWARNAIYHDPGEELAIKHSNGFIRKQPGPSERATRDLWGAQ